jgi:hypothetical protein
VINMSYSTEVSSDCRYDRVTVLHLATRTRRCLFERELLHIQYSASGIYVADVYVSQSIFRIGIFEERLRVHPNSVLEASGLPVGRDFPQPGYARVLVSRIGPPAAAHASPP